MFLLKDPGFRVNYKNYFSYKAQITEHNYWIIKLKKNKRRSKKYQRKIWEQLMGHKSISLK